MLNVLQKVKSWFISTTTTKKKKTRLFGQNPRQKVKKQNFFQQFPIARHIF